MTTTVTVKANHGWPVRVTAIDLPSGKETAAPTVAPGETRDFCVHSSMDLLIHEVQPEEIQEPAGKAPDWNSPLSPTPPGTES